MLSLPPGWVTELDDQAALLEDPDSRAAVLSALARSALDRGEIESEQLAEMLELTDAARLWALSEGEAEGG